MKKSYGFTLIELMVVVAIIGILAAIAVPAFNDQIRKSRRSDAITALQSWQLRFEQWRANNPSYADTSPSSANYPGLAANRPTSSYYNFAAPSNVTATTLTLSATAQGGQAADRSRGVSCTTLTIQINGSAITKTPAACWE
jgi:type IV pilus assembly protein PilE